MREQVVHFRAVFLVHAGSMSVRPVMAALVAPGVMQRVVGRRHEAGLVRPALRQFAARQRLLQPLGRVIAQPRVQHQVRAARHHVDGVDLQQSHARDHGREVRRARTPARRLQQALRVQLQATGLRQRERTIARGRGEAGSNGLSRH